jgi:hypothetical protein
VKCQIVDTQDTLKSVFRQSSRSVRHQPDLKTLRTKFNGLFCRMHNVVTEGEKSDIAP